MTAFAPLFVPAPVREAVSDAGWLAAMLEAERALAAALSLAGVIPAEAAAAIAGRCDAGLYDAVRLAEDGRAAGNPVEPLVRALRAQVGGDEARYVHWGATSQDVLDTAAMLVTRAALGAAGEELAGAAEAAARLASEHRGTPMSGRTLLQRAVPVTFGLRAAGWLVALDDARASLAAVVAGLPAQLGGAAGTLAPLGADGPEVLRLYAAELGLREPALPWHAQRRPVAAVGSLLDEIAAACGKVGLDVVLLAQTEVGEVSEDDGGVSSTMPQKRNPIRATLARACARGAHAQASLLVRGDEHELERAAGAWHAEWGALTEGLALAAGAAASARECLERLRVHPERMRANMSDGLVAERLAFAGRTGDDLLDPTTYLGSAEAFVDRALARHREGAWSSAAG